MSDAPPQQQSAPNASLSGMAVSGLMTPAAVTVAADTAEKAVTAVLNAPPSSEPTWARPAVAIYSLTLLLAILVYAAYVRDSNIMMLCVGAVIGMATDAKGYYIGSSASSARKTELAATTPITQGTTP